MLQYYYNIRFLQCALLYCYSITISITCFKKLLELRLLYSPIVNVSMWERIDASHHEKAYVYFDVWYFSVSDLTEIFYEDIYILTLGFTHVVHVIIVINNPLRSFWRMMI